MGFDSARLDSLYHVLILVVGLNQVPFGGRQHAGAPPDRVHVQQGPPGQRQLPSRHLFPGPMQAALRHRCLFFFFYGGLTPTP